MNRALITGVNGQDGSYLAELLIEKGYRVFGLVRRSSTNNLGRIEHIKDLTIIEGDLTDSHSVRQIVKDVDPDHIYNLAAQSHVASSFMQPRFTFEVDTIGVLNLLEAMKEYSPHARLLQASTSELYGDNFDVVYSDRIDRFQYEKTRFAPNSPYAVAKLAAHELVRVYRNSYGLFACCAISFNHESPRRGFQFVTRKITNYIGKLSILGRKVGKLKLGNIKSSRDWSHAKDVVKAMHMMLRSEKPTEYVISSNETHTIEEFLTLAFSLAFDNKYNWRDFVEIDETLFRPLEVPYLKGDSSLIREELGWKPEYSFRDLVEELVFHDIALAKRFYETEKAVV